MDQCLTGAVKDKDIPVFSDLLCLNLVLQETNGGLLFYSDKENTDDVICLVFYRLICSDVFPAYDGCRAIIGLAFIDDGIVDRIGYRGSHRTLPVFSDNIRGDPNCLVSFLLKYRSRST